MAMMARCTSFVPCIAACHSLAARALSTPALRAGRGALSMVGMRAVVVGLVAVLLCPASARAHAHLLSPAPRVPVAGKAPPCDGEPRTATPMALTAGQTLQVDWTETTDHPGYYRLLFSLAGDAGFSVLLDGIADRAIAPGDTANLYSATVQLPPTPCTDCTLQLIQVMTDKPSAPYYYSCADVRLVAAATTTSTLAPSAGTTTTTTTLVPCEVRPAYERVTCQLDAAAAVPVCADDPLGPTVQPLVADAVGQARALVDEAAVHAGTRPARRLLTRAGKRLGTAGRRAARMGKLTPACRTSVRDLVRELRAAIVGLRG